MTGSICYFPPSETEAMTKGSRSRSKSIPPLAKLHSEAIDYFPEDEVLLDGVTPGELSSLSSVIGKLQGQIHSELMLQSDYALAIATLEAAGQEPSILQRLLTTTISATVQKIRENPTQVQLVYPQSPWLPGYLKQLSTSLFEQGTEQTEMDYEQEKHLKLMQIGKLLKTTRERKQISRNQLYQSTHVLTSHIEAIEEGRFDRLPEDLYIKGFIRRLGEGLGLNGIALAATLPERQPTVGKPMQSEPTWAMEAARYAGYATLITGALGGLSWTLTQQQTNLIPLDPSLAEQPTANQLTQKNQTPMVQNHHSTLKIAPPESIPLP